MSTAISDPLCTCGHLRSDHDWGGEEYKDKTICNKCPEHDPCWEFQEED